MKIKAIVLVAAAVLAMGTAALAKDKGTLSKFPNWGVITVPDDIYMQSGRQPMLTAADEGNDVIALFERIFPIQPETYQVVKKDDADFQYAYLLHYTATIWDVKAAVYRQPAGYAHPHEPAEPEYAGTPSRGLPRRLAGDGEKDQWPSLL